MILIVGSILYEKHMCTSREYKVQRVVALSPPHRENSDKKFRARKDVVTIWHHQKDQLKFQALPVWISYM